MLPKKIIYDWLELQNTNDPFVREFYDKVNGKYAVRTAFGFNTDKFPYGLIGITVVGNDAYVEIVGQIGREFKELFGDTETNRKYIFEWFYDKFKHLDFIRNVVARISSKFEIVF